MVAPLTGTGGAEARGGTDEPLLNGAGDARAAPASPYFTLGEAATYARCHARTIRRWLDNGSLTRFGYGRRALVRRDQLEALLAPRNPLGASP